MSNSATLEQAIRARNSLKTRIGRLKRTPTRYGRGGEKSPIADIGVFEDEIDSVERAYLKMLKRINTARMVFDD